MHRTLSGSPFFSQVSAHLCPPSLPQLMDAKKQGLMSFVVVRQQGQPLALLMVSM
jgi:hypothetical protein